jgi:hypothetical protein
VRALARRSRVGTVATVAASMTIVVVLVGAAAFISLDDAGRRGVLGKVAELSYQFVVVVLLGALLKKVIDEAQDWRRIRDARREQQLGVIRRLINVSHALDRTRVLVLANRSVRMWTEQMNERVILAHTELRDIRHDERSATEAGIPLFARWATVLPEIRKMEAYLRRLINEFASSKKGLAELQLEAERNRSRQDEVWKRMCELATLGDLVKDGDGYGEFREAYNVALTNLRADVAGPPRDRRRSAEPSQQDK